MDRFLSGKTAVVTGGTRGIGRAIVAALASAGAKVAFCGRSPEAVDAAVRELKAAADGEIAGTAADVRNRDDVRALFEFTERTFGPPDILVNNAGVGVFSPVADLALEDWRRVIDINLTGVFHCSQEAILRFKARGGGFIINISSLAGKNPFAGGAAYNASKFGLNGFTEAMMLDHRHDNVRVSTVMPGSVDTDFNPPSGAARAGWKIAAEDIGEIVLDILRMPERTLISRVEVRPSRPQKH
jgi:NAD(P)-dependent dehydrogenase (short-subunit alcohol dehydrogenase family)